MQLGVRATPALVKGRKFIIAKSLDEVAKFVGVPGPGHTPLPPAELFARWRKILCAAQRYVRQIPDDQMNQMALHNRDRTIRLLGYHVFRIGEAYLECVVGGAIDLEELIRKPVKNGTLTNGPEIAHYGEEVIGQLDQWWEGLTDKSCGETREITLYGVISLHRLLDRSTWHSAHHTRQIVDVLDRLGIEPDRRFTAQDLAGLPLPERIWD